MNMQDRALAALDEAFNDEMRGLFRAMHLGSISTLRTPGSLQYIDNFHKGLSLLFNSYIEAQAVIKSSHQ